MESKYYIWDLHIHSPYSNGASNNITLEAIELEAIRKGINFIGTGDILCKKWFNECLEKLKDYGRYKYLNHRYKVNFIPTTEINLLVDLHKSAHLLLVFPDFETVPILAKQLRRYSLLQVGRPDIVMSFKNFVELVKSTSENILIITAHTFTPHFGILGSKNNFNLDILSFQPDALESGLSACPCMMQTIPELNNLPIVSFSDAHSIHNIGREVTITYTEDLAMSLKNKQFTTIEYPPQIGKYFYSGHRKCNHSSPENSSCPECHKPFTKGVMTRIKEFTSYIPPFDDTYWIPVYDLISYFKLSTYDKEIIKRYLRSIREFDLIFNPEKLQTPRVLEDILSIFNEIVLKKDYEYGYDGKYGKLKLDHH